MRKQRRKVHSPSQVSAMISEPLQSCQRQGTAIGETAIHPKNALRTPCDSLQASTRVICSRLWHPIGRDCPPHRELASTQYSSQCIGVCVAPDEVLTFPVSEMEKAERPSYRIRVTIDSWQYKYCI